jgi:hypothetical protein
MPAYRLWPLWGREAGHVTVAVLTHRLDLPLGLDLVAQLVGDRRRELKESLPEGSKSAALVCRQLGVVELLLLLGQLHLPQQSALVARAGFGGWG